MNNYLITVTGPTAIGKTSKSVALAKYFDTEILSADSRQFFKEMCIGTAVPNLKEQEGVAHHFVQHISVDDAYSVGDFEKDALEKLRQLFKKHRYVFMVGGSGLYVKAVNEGLDKFPHIQPGLRKKLNEKAANGEFVSLQNQLKELDPQYAQTVDLQNRHRVIRALEVCLSSGKPFSSFLNRERPQRPFKSIKIGLSAPREILYERIERRVDIMLEKGLLDEAKTLYPQRHKNALNTIGYKELYRHIAGEWTLEFAIEEIKKNTRRFAKRQLTWFRRDKSIHWFPYNCTAHEIANFIRTKTN